MTKHMQWSLGIFCIIAGSYLFCTTPTKKTIPEISSKDTTVITPKDSITQKTIAIKASVSNTTTIIDTPFMFSVNEWIGKQFVVLERQDMFKKFGYEMYLSKELEKSTSQVDTQFQLKNHRIRCDKFVGHLITAQAVEPVGSEWLCTFFDPTSGKTIFCKTHKGAINEIAYAEDLTFAMKNWKNKTLFSVKGVLSILEKTGFSTSKVKVEEPLLVYDIVWGTTPLPVKPLWLMVSTSDGKSGFIPVRASWTNVLSDMKGEGFPWDEDVLMENPITKYNIDDLSLENINNHNVINGMTKEMVFLSWGKPLQKFQKALDGNMYECWKYPSQVVYLDSNGVFAIRNE
jgi:hypothetical protein